MLGNMMEIFERELTLPELAVTENVVDQTIHHPLDSGRRGIIEGATGSLDNIRQHHQAGFFCLRSGTGIAIIINVQGRQLRTL
jgi:hypothetical protein